jgi:hypothetical protein
MWLEFGVYRIFIGKPLWGQPLGRLGKEMGEQYSGTFEGDRF